jgi:hypothetical protein
VDTCEYAGDITCLLSYPAMMVRMICKMEDAIKKYELLVTPMSPAYLRREQDATINNMGRLLSMWTEDHKKKKMPVNQQIIQQKALSLYEEMRKQNILLLAQDGLIISEND